MKNHNEKGQSLFELVVAIAISALIIISIVSLVTNALKSANFSKNNAVATSLAQETVEWLRSQRDDNIATFLAKADVNGSGSSLWCFVNLDWEKPQSCSSNDLIDNLFIREGNFVKDTVGGKTVIHTNIVVSWDDSQGNHEVTNSTDFTDWRQR